MASWVVAKTLETSNMAVVCLTEHKLAGLNEVSRGVDAKPIVFVLQHVLPQAGIEGNNDRD